MLSIQDFDIKGKTVFLRCDINSPIDPDSLKILDDSRLLEVAGTIDAGVLVNISDENLKSLTGHLKSKEFGEMVFVFSLYEGIDIGLDFTIVFYKVVTLGIEV